MTPRSTAVALALSVATVLLPAAARAGCSTVASGARCISVPSRPASVATQAMSSASTATPLVAVGEMLERGRYSIVINADYYGLPAVSDGWVYMRVGHDVFRVDWTSQQVLERVTDQTSANF